jgi:hypothetical protein
MAKLQKYTEAEMPPPGSVFITPLADGRYGAVLVTNRRMKDGMCHVFVTPATWIGSDSTRPPDSELRQPVTLTHHSWNGTIAGLWVFSPPPASFVASGTISLSELGHPVDGPSYGGWENCSLQILLQWRWDHDREQLLIEDAQRAERELAERREMAQKRTEMLKTITLSSLTGRQWFDHWDDELDGAYIQPSRDIILRTLAGLAESPKITKTLARKHLKAAVVAFNRLDEGTHYIETTHREDICEALELVMYAARQPDLASEIDEWRDW